MLDSGASVLVVPWKHGMKGEKTRCTLVSDHKAEGLIVSRPYTHSRIHLIVAVKEAVVFLPISYLVRSENYQASWKLHLDNLQGPGVWFPRFDLAISGLSAVCRLHCHPLWTHCHPQPPYSLL